jgi:CBS domain-containing protein
MVTSIPEFEEFLQDQDPGRQRVLDNSMLMEPIRRIDTAPPVTVESKTSIAETVRLMQERHIGCVLVTREGRLLGIFTERDVLCEVMGAGRNPKETAVDELMTENPETLSPDAAIAFALNKMSIGGFRHVPLVDDEGRPVGVVSVKDIVDYIVDFFPEVLNCPPEPGLNISKSREGA